MTGYPSIDKPWLKLYSEENLNTPLPKCSMYEYVWQHNKDNLNDVALEYFGNTITYGEMFESINKVALAFLAMEVKEGDYISICSATMPETIYCIYAANMIGAICNILEPRLNTDSIVKRINEVDTSLLLVQDVFYTKIADTQYNSKNTVILSTSNSMSMPTKYLFNAKFGKSLKVNDHSNKVISYNEFINKSEKKNKLVPCRYVENQPAVIIYTSGTTGLAKGAILTNDTINAVAYYFIDHNTCPRQTKYLDIMPLFIAYGLVCGMHMPLSFGWKIIIISKFEPQKFPKYIMKYRPNFFLGVPSHYEFLLNDKRLNKMDLSFVKVAAIGGDALNPALEKGIKEFFENHNSESVVYKGYGMTELSSAAVSTLSCEGGSKFGSLGVPFKYNTVSIFEPNTDNELKYGEMGEICITGPTMLLSYYDNQEETNKLFKIHRDGKKWIHSKDLGYMDEDGHLYFIDRIKRMIVRPDGHNVWPSVIELCVGKNPCVQECVVVGLPNPTGKNGKIPAAFVALKDGVERDKAEIEKELREICLKEIPEREVALLYYFIDEIPHTPIGKVDYRALEDGDWEIGEYTL